MVWPQLWLITGIPNWFGSRLNTWQQPRHRSVCSSWNFWMVEFLLEEDTDPDRYVLVLSYPLYGLCCCCCCCARIDDSASHVLTDRIMESSQAKSGSSCTEETSTEDTGVTIFSTLWGFRDVVKICGRWRRKWTPKGCLALFAGDENSYPFVFQKLDRISWSWSEFTKSSSCEYTFSGARHHSMTIVSVLPSSSISGLMLDSSCSKSNRARSNRTIEMMVKAPGSTTPTLGQMAYRLFWLGWIYNCFAFLERKKWALRYCEDKNHNSNHQVTPTRKMTGLEGSSDVKVILDSGVSSESSKYTW